MKETAYFGAGCFWKPQLVFDKTKGVIETSVGYMGGKVKNPNYPFVCKGNTGHIEIVRVIFESDEISYGKLLKLFFKIHDPTQYNGQGSYIGEQYKPVVFYTSMKQKEEAKRIKKEVEKSIKGKKVYTEIRSAKEFYIAEDYHQKYLEKRSME